MRILVIEDEKRIASFIKRGLKEEHYAVDVAFNGVEGLHLALSIDFDLIILDIMLPDISGINLCKELRKTKHQVPVLMLTAKGSVEDKVSGLDAGADDYLTKPFAFEEFLARVRSLIRRNHKQSTNILTYHDLELNQVTHQVFRNKKELFLTNKEYSLLKYFMFHAEKVVTRTMITEHVWNEDFDSLTNVIDVYINFLRKKIDKDFSPKLLHTLRGTGYILKIGVN